MSEAEILEGRESVESYLRSAFPRGALHPIECERLGDFVFRVEEDDRWYEVSFSEEALEDNRGELEEILQSQDAVSALRENPNSRLPFITETLRVLPREELRVRMGSMEYLVTRENSLVRIFDEESNPLENMPDTRTYQSIHKGSLSRWPEQIEKWRGKNQ
jgi:hypothetical protein